MFVRDVMTTQPQTIAERTTIFDALELMRKGKISRLPVVKDGRLVGIVTELDLIRVSPSTATSLSVFELHYLLSKMTVNDAMSKDVITTSPDATIEQAAIIMRDSGVSGLPVVQGDKLIGIVTETNLFDAMLEHFGSRSGGVRVTLSAEDKPGQLAMLADVIRDLGGNIVSLVTSEPVEGRGQVVARVTGVATDLLVAELGNRGLRVIHVAE